MYPFYYFPYLPRKISSVMKDGSCNPTSPPKKKNRKNGSHWFLIKLRGRGIFVNNIFLVKEWLR